MKWSENDESLAIYLEADNWCPLLVAHAAYDEEDPKNRFSEQHVFTAQGSLMLFVRFHLLRTAERQPLASRMLGAVWEKKKVRRKYRVEKGWTVSCRFWRAVRRDSITHLLVDALFETGFGSLNGCVEASHVRQALASPRNLCDVLMNVKIYAQ